MTLRQRPEKVRSQEADMASKWVVLDLETTGLDPEGDTVLECAALVVDPMTLAPEASFHHVSTIRRDRVRANEYVMRMHTENGLLEALTGSACVVGAEVAMDVALLAFLRPHANEGHLHLAGNSIHFDRSFMRRRLPISEKLLHYRMVDATSLMLVANTVGKGPSKGPVAHRAMADVLSTLDQLRWAQEVFRG